MTLPLILRTGAVVVALATLPNVALAQAIMPRPTPTADALASQMAILGSDPRNVPALIAAGELSTRLGDTAAAMAFFSRAQAVEPGNPRIAAGRAGALVLMERPGEALRLYDQAERAGVTMTPYRAQRGLAYDLIGQSGYAQREYRRALQDLPVDDEVTRRLALSLGIAGKRDEAMALLDPLLRKSDRAAWRAHACILALGGDVAGADRIAAGMIPGGQALGPFFRRLSALSPADRAFAVHFGQLATTSTRITDARMAPTLPLLPADVVPVQPRLEVAAKVEPAPVERRRTGRPARSERTRPVELALRPAQPAVTPTSRTASAPSAVIPPQTVAPASVQNVASSPTMVAQQPVSDPQPAPAPAPAMLPAPQPVQVATTPPAPARPPVTMEIIDAPRPLRVAPAQSPVAAASPPPAVVAPRRRANETLLASIVAGIQVPASERDERTVTPLQRPRPSPRATVATRPDPSVAAKPARTSQVAKVTKAEAKSDVKTTRAKSADVKKPEAKPDTPRWWVQVAGGARAADLDKDWQRLTAKSAALKGKGAYVTPLRATNRLLTGPFKTEAEARAVVNALSKEGKSAFTFQSSAGQKVDPLDAR